MQYTGGGVMKRTGDAAEVVRVGVGHWLGQVPQSHTQAVICEMSHTDTPVV